MIRDGSATDPYPPTEDYASLADCHSVALVSRHGSIDAPSFFGLALAGR